MQEQFYKKKILLTEQKRKKNINFNGTYKHILNVISDIS